MTVRISTEARDLGLAHARAWRLSSPAGLLRDDGLNAEQVAAMYDAQAPLPEGYRKLLAGLGHPEVVPAGERLRDVVAGRGWASHGAVVDAVSVATLRHGAGIGLHRMPGAGQELLIRRASGGERIVPAFSSKSRPVPVGDLLYGVAAPDGTGFEPLAWLGRRDCDAAGWQVADGDREAVMVVLGCPGEGAEHTEEIGRTVARILAEIRPDVHVEPLA
ncbi:hypothetical protein ACIQOU_00825 [Streptomyces sp. NPDC091279]|uniref:hypothetical protein n=1 Tax=unclassified Streptomyces TaxID=2593676 RepID=UPI00381F3B02